MVIVAPSCGQCASKICPNLYIQFIDLCPRRYWFSYLAHFTLRHPFSLSPCVGPDGFGVDRRKNRRENQSSMMNPLDFRNGQREA